MARIAYEDLTPGRRFDLGNVEIDRDEMLEFARRFDPQPFHLDEAAGRRSLLGGLAASGWYTMAIWMRAYVQVVLSESTAEGSPGGTMTWHTPVFAGDTLQLSIEINSARRSRSKPNLGIVEIAGMACFESV